MTVRKNDNEICEDCNVTTSPGTFSPCLPITNQISNRKYDTGKGKKGQYPTVTSERT